jgi:hypothetical protein
MKALKLVALTISIAITAGCTGGSLQDKAIQTAIAKTEEFDRQRMTSTSAAEATIVATMATDTPAPTNTPGPTNTPSPSPSATPTWAPVPLGDLEQSLKDNGFTRFPIVDNDGVAGFIWTSDNAYERVRTWETWMVQLQVLHDKSPSSRSKRMERKLSALNTIFPAEFMSELREKHADYNRAVASSVSGEPDEIHAYSDEWNTVWAEYYASESTIDGYRVRFSLWWWQSTCPAHAWYCYYSGFPGLEFTGDSSLVFYTIRIWIDSAGLPSSSST